MAGYAIVLLLQSAVELKVVSYNQKMMWWIYWTQTVIDEDWREGGRDWSQSSTARGLQLNTLVCYKSVVLTLKPLRMGFLHIV